MKILHTADWHLGKRLGLKERTEDHQQFLAWLLDTIEALQVEVLVVAGDIFDTGTPSNAALKLYYDFLWQVKNTCCRHVVIVGGNHDSVSTLNAPKDLLHYFSVHVAGGVSERPEEQVIPIVGLDGVVELVVCAVPFLRDKDVKLSMSGETAQEREERIRSGIEQYYKDLVPYLLPYKQQGIPVLATGHLFAAGGQATPDSEKEIHVGNLAQMSGSKFPAEFDYVALGHLHRPQLVNKMEHIRYSGSPIALSFSENEDQKKVVVVDFSAGRLQRVEEVPVPTFRRMVRLKGSLEKIIAKLLLLIKEIQDEQSVWLEVQVETDTPIYDVEERLQLLVRDRPSFELLFIKQLRLNALTNINEQLEDTVTLNDLSPTHVFEKKCISEFPDKDCSDLLSTFREALELMREEER